MKKTKILGSIFTLSFLCLFSANASNLAKIGDKVITDSDIKAEFEGITGDQRKMLNEDLNTRKSLVDNLVNSELLFEAAKKSGLDKDEIYKKAVEKFQRQYLASLFLGKSVDPKLTKNEVKKFFDSNKPLFDSTQVCAKHIVMLDESEARKVAELAKSKGSKFDELAKKHSLDPTVQENKGDLGCFTRERMVPEFSTVAFDMKKNEIKGPVKTMYGYHIIQVYDTKPGKVPNYEEVEQRAKDTYRSRLVNNLISELRTKSNVKIEENEVKGLKF